MNKKGSYELADLAGFILIFIAIVIFGFIFVKFSPESNFELIENERGNYLVKADLLDYLCHNINGETIADLIVEGKLDLVEKKTKELLGKDRVSYWITISKGKDVKEIIIPGEKMRYKPEKVKYNYHMVLKNDMKVLFVRLYEPGKLALKSGGIYE